MRKPEPKAPPKRMVNLLSYEQVEAIIDGIARSAFTVLISEGEDTVATLLSAGTEVFRINLTSRVIHRKRDGKEERVYGYGPDRLFRSNPDRYLFERLEAIIRIQYSTGGDEAFTANLITRKEVTVLIDAIRAMAFKIDRVNDVYIFYFDGREVFRVDREKKTISLIGLSKSSELVYTFIDETETWFWAGTDRKLWRDLIEALEFYNATMHKVRMADYRALFGNQMQKVITGLVESMEEAEADVRLLEKVDKTGTGHSLHPDVARLVQKDLDAGEENAEETKED